MAAWGNRSCSPLLRRIEESNKTQNPIKSITILPTKTYTNANETHLINLISQGHLTDVNAGTKKAYSPSEWGKAMSASKNCKVTHLNIGDKTLTTQGLTQILDAGTQCGSLRVLRVSDKGLGSIDLGKVGVKFPALEEVDGVWVEGTRHGG